MITIEQRTLDFLNELYGLSNANNNQNFWVDIIDKNNDPRDFKFLITQALYRSGAININDKDFGLGKNKKGEVISIANIYSLEAFGIHPQSLLITINKDNFDAFYALKRHEAEDLVRCHYRDYVCILTANNKPVSFSGVTGLILYYMFLARTTPNNQDYESFNVFMAKEGYIDKFAIVNSTQFRQKVKELNERAKKDTKKYLNLLIKTIKHGNKKSEYKWEPEITKI